ncbi:MAG: 50S ribosomal protein L21 [Bacteroides sp.]|nr:50S ribosomal protein L21 [Bacteroidales bacterium]MBD5302945.1 50S ribosomal protein L21 [Bacteroides sp.]MBD5205513.1 50S ribosomal protein L21 [Bacteroidales bacterium]MBD5223893.1 50S ribosomal protein L21 [Bacteroidales bacterium]MBD5304709.1 50S ribosomal protein L21 [Bacteroides sp.]
MYAIVEIKGQQFKAEEGKYLYVHHLGDEVKEGETVSFDKVLLLDNEGSVKVGVPTVEGAKVECEIVAPLVKGDKVIVFKKKRRKGYRRLNGHRQQFSKVIIKKIVTA